MESKQLQLKRTTGLNLDFVQLVKNLDAYLTVVNKDNDAFFRAFNTIDALKYVIVLYKNNKAVACGAIKPYTKFSIEIKRMFVCKNERKQGYASLVLKALEGWASTLGYKKCILETSREMQAAVKLYKANGYICMPNYPPYINQETSCCFQKKIE